LNRRDEAVGRAAAAQLPGLPRNEDGPVFGEPWQAAAFALAVSLSQQGHFSLKEWAASLAEELKMSAARGEPDDGSHYYHCWLATLERLIVAKGLSQSEELVSCKEAWADAHRRTPHGKPVELENAHREP
jgi:nitrile hydratase accessory protein